MELLDVTAGPHSKVTCVSGEVAADWKLASYYNLEMCEGRHRKLQIYMENAKYLEKLWRRYMVIEGISRKHKHQAQHGITKESPV